MHLRGMTSTDVLVMVVAILTLGALSLGAAQNSRQEATLTLCAGNMRQIGEALLVYAADSRQTLPPECLRGVRNFTPATSYRMTDVDAVPWGLSALLSNKYLSTPRVLFCPAQKITKYSFDSIVKADWPKEVVEANAGYLYQVHTVRNTGLAPYNATATKDFGDGDSFVCAAYTKVSEFPPNLFVLMEVVDGSEAVPHDQGTTMNALFIDGSVKAAITDEFVKIQKSGTTSPMANLSAFSEVIAIWENAVK